MFYKADALIVANKLLENMFPLYREIVTSRPVSIGINPLLSHACMTSYHSILCLMLKPIINRTRNLSWTPIQGIALAIVEPGS